MKRFKFAAVGVVSMVMLGFCFLLTASPARAARLKIATLSPEGSFWMEAMRKGSEEVAQRTEGRVTFKFYPGGVMGDDKAVLRKIRIGQLQGGAVVLGSLSPFFDDSQIYSLPLKFRSFEEVDYVRGKMDSFIMEGLEKGGFVTFGLAEGGFAYMMSSAPIRTVSDLRRQKVWVPDNDAWVLVWIKAYEVTPIPLSLADVRAGLQTGLIDTVTAPPIAVLALQWHTRVKYLMDVPILYISATLGVDRKVFSKISPEDQAVVREVMGNAFRKIDQRNREDNIQALAALKNQGVEFIEPSEAAREEWRQRAEQVPKQLIEAGRMTAGAVETLNRHLREFRSR